VVPDEDGDAPRSHVPALIEARGGWRGETVGSTARYSPPDRDDPMAGGSMRRLAVLGALASLLSVPLVPAASEPARPLLVFAAVSLTDALREVGAAYTEASGQPVKFSFASSGVLARQLEAGADADVFVSADSEWMDYVEVRGLIDRSTRYDLLTNRLVLIAPSDRAAAPVSIGPGFELADALGGGRLALGDPESVPAGRYARAALISLGLWAQVSDRLVRADNVRAALAFVARGEAPLGIVYETDARAEPGVAVIAAFPADSHPPIVYPVAVVANARAGASEFVAYLHGPRARAVFERWGFGIAAHADGEAVR
jgi:molybdate transport system substrate-binding protein